MLLRYQKEVPSTIGQLGNFKNKKLIEFGCSTGRFTQKLLKCKNILAVDFSKESLVVLSQKLASQKNIGLVLADAIQLRTEDNFFEHVLVAKLLEHIPGKVVRQKFLKNIKSTLKNQGRFVCSAYYNDIRRRIKKKPAEGFHQGVIFFHYFSKKEIKEEFKPIFKINKMKIIDITLPLEARLGLTKYFKGHVSRFF